MVGLGSRLREGRVEASWLESMCESEDDCVSSTLEGGWDVDLEVICVDRLCRERPEFPDS